LNVLEGAHAGGCWHNRVLGDDGKVERGRLEEAIGMINQEWPHRPGVLVHCGAGVERSPLVVAMWMTARFNVSLDEAYAWIKAHRPQIEDRRQWL
jgi:protein-tyrosine phosphatase